MKPLRKMCIAAMLAVVTLLPAISTPSAALAASSTRIVDNYYPSPTACKGAAYATIQSAVDTFTTGQSGTIKVCAGSYVENVEMTGLGTIKLLGDPGAAIVASGTATLIRATSTKQLTVQGFTLDGGGNALSSGVIEIQDSGAAITKNIFQNSPGGSYGVKVSVTSGTRVVSVARNQFTNVENGIYAVSSGGTMSAKVTGNFFTQSVNGIFIGAGPTGSATATVTGNHMQGAYGTGILLQGVNKGNVSGNTIQDYVKGVWLLDPNLVTVSHNKMRSSEFGIRILASSTASSNKVLSNIFEVIQNGYYGIDILVTSAGAANLTQIVGNTITDLGAFYSGTYGIVLDNSVGGSLNKTVIKSNKAINIQSPYAHNGDTLTTFSGNKCTPIAPAPCIP